MRLDYFPETDSLYIDLAARPSTDSHEVVDGVVLDYDAQGRLVGIDIDEASTRVELGRLILTNLPGTIETAAA